MWYGEFYLVIEIISWRAKVLGGESISFNWQMNIDKLLSNNVNINIIRINTMKLESIIINLNNIKMTR